MQIRNRFISTTLLSLCFLLAAQSCDGTSPKTSTTNDQDESQTELEVTATSTPEPSPTPKITPTTTSTPDRSDQDDALEFIEEILWFGTGGAEGGSVCSQSFIYEEDLLDKLPTVRKIKASARKDFISLCLFGFPIEDEIKVKLFTPQGDLLRTAILQTTFQEQNIFIWYKHRIVAHLEDGGYQTIGFASDIGPAHYFQFYLWLPRGRPTGSWQIQTISSQGVVEEFFDVDEIGCTGAGGEEFSLSIDPFNIDPNVADPCQN